MAKDGYWVAGEGYSLGYPIGVAGFGMYGGMTTNPAFKPPQLLWGLATTTGGLATRCAP